MRRVLKIHQNKRFQNTSQPIKPKTDHKTHLSSVDPILAELVKRFEIKKLSKRKNHFQSLVHSVIGQQLSTKAASTIRKRFLELFPNAKFPTPKQLLSKKDESLRKAGLSYSKISYVKNIARAIEEKSVAFNSFSKLSDEEILIQLTKIKGIGPWTAEMFLIFSLGREDVFSIGDLGLQNAIKKAYRLKKITKKDIETLSLEWKPFRSYACLYLWASLDNEPKN